MSNGRTGFRHSTSPLANLLVSFVLASGVTRERDDRRDRQLFGDLAAGRSCALGGIYDRHAASLFRHACALAGRHADAEDLVHAVFMKLAAMGPDLLGVRQPAAYVHRMLHRAWVDGHRRAATGERLMDGMAGPAAVTPMRSAAEAIDLARALDALPAEQREVVVLHAFDGFSFREIGGLTGVSMFTAAARYRLAIGKMKQRLAPVGQDRQ